MRRNSRLVCDQATSLRSPATSVGRSALRDLATGHDELGVARQRGGGFGRARRLRVQAVQHDHVAGAQAHAGADRRNVRLEQEAHFRIDQLQPRQQHHAVGVGQRMGDPERMMRQGILQVPAPPFVGLDREDQIGILCPDDVLQPVDLAVWHEHVDDHQAEGARSGRRLGLSHLDRPQRGVGQDHRELHREAPEQRERQRRRQHVGSMSARIPASVIAVSVAICGRGKSQARTHQLSSLWKGRIVATRQSRPSPYKSSNLNLSLPAPRAARCPQSMRFSRPPPFGAASR